MNHVRPPALISLAALLVAGCSGPPLPDPATPLPSPVVDTKLGQDTRLYPSDSSDAQMTLAVDKITVDPTCGTNGHRAAGTHTVVLDVRVSTDTVAADADAESLAKRIRPLAFRVYDAAEEPHASLPDTCTDPAPPIAYASNSTYRSQIAFTVDTAPVEVSLPITGSRGTEVLVWKV